MLRVASSTHDPTYPTPRQAGSLDSDRQDEAERQADLDILIRLASIEAKLDALSREKAVRDYYSVEEFAERVGKKKFTVREWCRLGRINAEKRDCGRGNSCEWRISNHERLRYMRDGLLPDPRRQ